MRGRRGLFSLFTSLPDHPEDEYSRENKGATAAARRRRRHSSGGDRETWSRKVEYVFATLGYAVGLGNIWRFPYLCYRNGGGAFLIPYTLALFAVGFPMVFLEMAFGQFASTGCISIWRVCPLFKGIGYAIIVVLILVNTYYNVLIAYALYYLFASITNELPWAKCGNQWNTDKCIIERYDPTKANLTANVTSALYNITTAMPEIDRKLLKTPTEEYFERHLLNRTDGIDDLGSLQWPLIICLAVSWFTCFWCLFKGIKSMGKAVIFTTIFSYVILTVLLIRGVSLPGAKEGIIYYLKPEWHKLGQMEVWGEASAQAFASLTLGGGGWITLSSYNKFNNRCNRDAVMVGIGNALTSFYSGFVIFSVLGYMAYIKGTDVADVTTRGPGLAFVAYPEGLALIPGAPLWSICFFFMMFTVGLDSLFGQVETIAAGIIDEYPDLLRPNRKLFTLFLCVFMFLLGIPLVTQGGIYIVTLMDWYSMLFSFSIICFFEIVVIIYVYGYPRFAGDIEIMLGKKPNMYFKVTWLGVSPLILVCVMAFLAVDYVPAYYGDYNFPPYAESIGWCVALLPCALIPIFMVVQFFRKAGSIEGLKGFFTDAGTRQEIKHKLIYPQAEWGPALPDIRRKYSYDVTHPPPGDADDVFAPEGAELVSVTHKDPDGNDVAEKQRLVKFKENEAEAPPPYEESEKDKEEKKEEDKAETKDDTEAKA